jgi:hypothetical protein
VALPSDLLKMVHPMKKSIAILFLVFQIPAFSQSITDNLTNALDQTRYNKPPDQVFLHLDRNLYHPGDTVRFQAYIRDRKTGITGSASISLYSLLLNQAHKTIDSARFRITNSTASGWLKIPETIPNGIYSVLAFTSNMMNYDPEFVFSVPIRIDELKPANLGMDQLAGKKGPPSYQKSSDQPVVNLRFLPEGGTFIYNVLQRVAFNVVTSSGRTLKVTGEIKNQRGEKVAELISGEFGPGLVEFTPLREDKYFATLKGEEFSGMKWPLPIPDSSGIAMRVDNNRKEIIDVSLAGRGVENKTWLLAITMNNALILSQDVRLDSLLRLSVKTEELPAGTAYITLYDNELNPVAERLLFVNDNKKMNIGISSSSSDGDETELILKTTDDQGENISSVISVAVVDSASGFCNTLPFPDIESTFLFDRDFYNNLPAGIKIHGLHNIDKKSIDLLLMTYGWRKFNVRENTEINPAKEFVNYDYFKISNLAPEKKNISYVQVVSVEDHIVHTLTIIKNKEVIIPFDSLNDNVRQLMILENNFNTKNISSAKIVFPENRSFTDKAKRQNNYVNNYDDKTSILVSDNLTGIKIPIPNMKEFYFSPDSVINIEEVTIKPKRIPVLPPAYINKYERLYMSGSLRTMTNKDFAAWPSIEYILALFNPYYLDVENKMVFLSSRRDFHYNPALFVLDDDPIGNSYEMIEVIPTSEIESITVLKGRQGFTRYGAAALGGVVFITRKTGLDVNQDKKNDNLMKPVSLFRTEIEYYIPAKEEVDTVPGLQYRQTILWMNEVFIDGEEPVKIRYPDNMRKGTAIVIVDGVSSTNSVGSGSFRYKIK